MEITRPNETFLGQIQIRKHRKQSHTNIPPSGLPTGRSLLPHRTTVYHEIIWVSKMSLWPQLKCLYHVNLWNLKHPSRLFGRRSCGTYSQEMSMSQFWKSTSVWLDHHHLRGLANRRPNISHIVISLSTVMVSAHLLNLIPNLLVSQSQVIYLSFKKPTDPCSVPSLDFVALPVAPAWHGKQAVIWWVPPTQQNEKSLPSNYSFLGEIFKFQSIPWLICFYLQVADSAVSLSNLATALGFHTGQACDGEGEVEVTLGCPVPPFPPSKIQTVFPKVSWMVASHQLYKRRPHDDMLVSLDIVLSKKHVFQDATPAARGPPAAPRSCGVNKPPQCGGVSMVQ